jgi:N6-L-threonylcarbamoyladenine synthase
MNILGIETSCDETAASVIEGEGDKVRVLSNVVSSQIEIHQKYGGVVPEVAAREHVFNILPVVNEALIRAGMDAMSLRGVQRRGNLKSSAINQRSPRFLRSLAMTRLDAIAVTVGPGLITSLQVGVETAKTLAYVWKLPVVAVNHIESHLYSNFIDRDKIEFPALILTVSGGHTILVLMRGHGKYKIIGETRDDAAGEAFDKAASLLGLGYPGGPAISREAAKFISIQNTQPHPDPLLSQERAKEIKLPRPMLESKDFDFSFSGLKTALLYQLKKDPNWQKRIPEYAYEFQRAAVETLVGKTIRAAKQLPVKTVMLSGGVAANTALRQELKEETEKLGLKFLMPELKYTTDNATMVAAAGYFKARRKKFTPWQKLATKVNWELV